jgi:hypothetical protein
MASVPGKQIKDPTPEEKHNIARRPFEGINNFFRDVKLKRTENMKPKKIIDDAKIFFPFIFDDIYKILSLVNENKLLEVENSLVSNPEVIIYPSYYFNPNSYIFPKKLLSMAICINLWKLDFEKSHTKTNITRSYKINTQGILARLKENPKDRFKNLNKS